MRFSYGSDTLSERKHWDIKTYLIVGLIGSLILIPSAIALFILGLFHKRLVIQPNSIVLIRTKDEYLFSIPLSLINNTDYQKILNYFKKQMNLDINNLEVRNLSYPHVPKRNISETT
jgi:hypothetical protein